MMHTPGPWETLTFTQHDLQTDFAMVKLGDRVHMIGYSDEDKANARMIAAAPDLLETVDELLGTLLQCFPDAPIDSVIGKNIISARAAIAKATGVA